MNNYIIFLRGINVSGKNILKMQLLKNSLKAKHFPKVQTYIQSGNILIPNTTLSPLEIKTIIETTLSNEFGINSNCFVFKELQLTEIYNNIPFLTENTKEIYFTFIEHLPAIEILNPLQEQNYKGDEFSATKNCIYIKCINGFGKTKLNTNFFEKKLQTEATTRNYNTLLKMITLAKEI